MADPTSAPADASECDEGDEGDEDAESGDSLTMPERDIYATAAPPPEPSDETQLLPTDSDRQIFDTHPPPPLPESSSRASAPQILAEGDDALEIAEALRDPEARLGRYVILRELGAGGMGVVLKAFDPNLCRTVAIKQIRGEAAQALTRRFEREARVLAQLTHPNVVAVYEGVAEGPGAPYLAMEFVPGEALIERCRRGPLAGREAAEILAPVAEAIAYAHAQGVVHRDLKPHNVMLGEDGVPRVLDFGLATRQDSNSITLTTTGMIMGTPAYMAPEQAEAAEVGPPADVWGLGATLYECLTGRPPFQAATPLAVIHAVTHQEPPAPRELRPQVSRDLETICLKCLEKEPERRYPSALAMAQDLRRFLAGEAIEAQRDPAAVRALRRMWRNRAVAAPSVLALLLLVLLGIAALRLESAAEEGQVARAQATAAEAARATAEAEREVARAEQAREARQRGALRSAVGALDRLGEVLRFRYRPLLPEADEERLVQGARAEAAQVISALDASLQQAPELADLHLLRGRAALQLYELDDARAAAQAAIQLDPECGPAYTLLAESLCSQLALVLFDKGVSSARRKEWLEGAMAAQSRAAALGERATPAGRIWGLILRQRLEQAGAMIAQALRGSPDELLHYLAAMNRAQQGLRKHEDGLPLVLIRDEVLPELNAALELCPRLLPALYGRAIALRELGRFAEAYADLRVARRLKPDFVSVLYDLAQVCTLLSRWPETQEICEELLRLQPEHPKGWNALGFAHLNQGRPREALACLERSLAQGPLPLAHVNRARLRQAQRDTRGALADYASALELDPECVQALNGRALLRGGLGDVAGALADLDRAVALDPADPIPLANRCKFRIQQQKFAAAIADADRSIALRPLGTTYFYRALAKASSGQLEPARADLDQAIERTPEDASFYVVRGQVLRMQDKPQEAARDFATSLRLDPNQAGAAGLRAFVERYGAE